MRKSTNSAMDEWSKLLNHVHKDMKNDGMSYKQAMMIARHYNIQAKKSGYSDPVDCTNKAIELFDNSSVSERRNIIRKITLVYFF